MVFLFGLCFFQAPLDPPQSSCKLVEELLLLIRRTFDFLFYRRAVLSDVCIPLLSSPAQRYATTLVNSVSVYNLTPMHGCVCANVSCIFVVLRFPPHPPPSHLVLFPCRTPSTPRPTCGERTRPWSAARPTGARAATSPLVSTATSEMTIPPRAPQRLAAATLTTIIVIQRQRWPSYPWWTRRWPTSPAPRCSVW